MKLEGSGETSIEESTMHEESKIEEVTEEGQQPKVLSLMKNQERN